MIALPADSPCRLWSASILPSRCRLAPSWLAKSPSCGQTPRSSETVSNEAGQDLESVFLPIIQPQIASARKALEEYLNTHTELPVTEPKLAELLAAGGIDLLALRKPLGAPLPVFMPCPIIMESSLLTLHSDGPDKAHSTADDFEVPFASWRWFAGHQLELRNAVAVFHKRTGRFIRTLADLHRSARCRQKASGSTKSGAIPGDSRFAFSFSIAANAICDSGTFRGRSEL